LVFFLSSGQASWSQSQHSIPPKRLLTEMTGLGSKLVRCPSSELFGMLRRFRNGGSDLVSFRV
jgi:hypothetical protein